MSYLSLLVPIVKTNLIGLCLDDNALFTLKEENIWFEHASSKVALKWFIIILFARHLQLH
jgi:hypothetical protein